MWLRTLHTRQAKDKIAASELWQDHGLIFVSDVYGHLLVDDKRAAAEAMSGALFGA
ncbi:hypothetical protein [Actinomadura sp. NTSP31]|uniref:hypothetical protein n=1 Tax=Actinomadura sp. NTSP31 TaxID=1735447 RepID=UPI0035C1F0B3